MSNLSDFILKPYAGLTKPDDRFIYSAQHPQFIFIAEDSASAIYPTVALRNSSGLAGAGGDLSFQAKNGAGSFVLAAFVKGTLEDVTAGSEQARLTLSVLQNGAQKAVMLNGNFAPSFAPSLSADFTLGSSSQRWGALYVGDPTGTITGSIVPDFATQTVYFGSDSAANLAFKTQNAVVSRIASFGGSAAVAIGTTVAPTYQLRVGGTHPGTGNVASVRADSVLQPSTNLGTGFWSAPSTAPASWVYSEIAHFFATDVVKGAGTSVSTQIGLHVPNLVAGDSNRGLQIEITAGAPGTNYAIYASGDAPSYLRGNLGINSAAPTTRLDVLENNGGGLTVARLLAQAGSFSGTILKLAGLTAGGGYDALAVTDSTGVSTLRYRGDGTLMLAGAGVAATQFNAALLSVAGRVAIAATNPTFDLSLPGAALAATQIIDGSPTVATAREYHALRVVPTPALAGTAKAYGVRAEVNPIAGASSASAVGVSGRATALGNNSGTYIGVEGIATDPGNTGLALIGGFFQTNRTLASATILRLAHAGRAGTGVYISAVNAGEPLDTGIFLGGNSLIGVDAVYYGRYPGSTANFLRLVDEFSIDRFAVDKDGNLVSKALTVYGNADVTLGPVAATTVMTTGFPYLPSVGGTPTGVPTARAGFAPIIHDSAAHKLWVYDGGWKFVTLT